MTMNANHQDLLTDAATFGKLAAAVMLKGKTAKSPAAAFELARLAGTNALDALGRDDDPACPGCSGGGVRTGDRLVLKCTRCGGVFTDPKQPITFEAAQRFVALNQAMLPNAGADGPFMFDLDVLDVILADGKTANRLHGWADKRTKRVVQWG